MNRIAIVLVVCVLVAGCRKTDPLYCGKHETDPTCGPGDASIEDAPVDAPPGFFTIGGSVFSNLTGTGLVLENNGADDLMITTPGTFQFTMPIEMGTTYAVTASSQPTNPSQQCTVASGAGTANGDVTDISISCATNKYVVSGSAYGLLAGQSVKLYVNGGDEQDLSGTGATQSFSFATAPIDSGNSFVVTAMTPAGVTCEVTGGMGTIGDADVTTVIVNCATNSYTISGEVSGLNGKTILSDGTNMITVSANGSFSFPPLAFNSNYTVVVMTQPAYPPYAQTCVVAGGGPGMLTGDVMSVTVTCTTNGYTIGGSVAALTGTLMLLDNGSDSKKITANGGFTFATPVASGATYMVTVQTQPTSQVCTVSAGNGTVTNSNITSVSVECDSGISCGQGQNQKTCPPATEVCCNPEGPTPTCISKTNACVFKLPCDDAADCTLGGTPGLCCASENSGSVNSVSCAATCSGSGLHILCDPNVVGACPAGKTCLAYGHFPGYFDCQ